jgi:leader peptidase (prepilin peptidase)/N-methyltransferase
MLTTLISLNPGLCFFLLGLFSLLVGSLLNVVIYRLPVMLDQTWRNQCSLLLDLPVTPIQKHLNLFTPRSFCTACKATIPGWHNIPLLSFILLRGRCASCQHAISFRYPLVELLCVLLSLAAGHCFGFTPTLIAALLFIWFMLCLACIDLTHQLLPDGLTLSLLWLGLMANTNELFTSLPNAVLSAAGAYVALWLFIQLFYLATGKIGMGHGDFKLFAAFGAWFGWTQLPFILLMSSLTGAVFGLSYLKITGKSNDHPIPFGPFLCFAGLVSLFYGQSLMTWYLAYFIQN